MAMLKSKVFYLAVSLGALCAATVLPAHAQTGTVSNVVTGPSYDSGAAAGQLSDGNFNTPESDGRPGVKFFAYGVQAFKKGDVTHAIRMYKVAASWAYKPAEYNLGVMYFKGQGVPQSTVRSAPPGWCWRPNAVGHCMSRRAI
jgi:TPR repeat protein